MDSNTLLKTQTILLIDDDKPMLLGLKTFLERNGYNVAACERAQTQ
ncbi:hypothetical protein [Candidatus Villigracilis saccharophilus]|nr:hypothetical protein [Anaerolineales bacterium]